jgi:very-short-patch-repair endonuclease
MYTKRKYDWKAIQLDFDNGLTWREVEAKYGCRNTTILKAKRRGELRTPNRSQALKISHSIKPHLYFLTPETKKKISDARKRYILKYPEKAPYRLHHSSHGPSYPETYFKQVFENAGLTLKQYLPFGLYELDFACLKSKIAIEIDGSQHRYDKRIVASDLRKDNFLAINGWRVIRIYWPEYCKKKIDDKKAFVLDIVKCIERTDC